jgi:signal transduction histidine kinase
MLADDLRGLDLFAGLSDEQLAELVAGSTEVATATGDVPFREGEHADSWWVLLDGTIDLFRHVGREDVLVARMDAPGRWAGGFRAWDEGGVYLATGRVAEPGRVLDVPAPLLRERFDAWFPFPGHLISGLYHTARSIESTARQRDSLVTLGTLAAGLAHEINNPAAAATRAVDGLDEACRSLLDSLRRLADEDVTASQFAALDRLRTEVRLPDGPPDPLERSDREQAVGAWLRRHRVADDWRVGSSLAAAGADVAWCDRVCDVLDDEALGAGLDWVASTFSAVGLLSEVKESTRRISELVAAVRSYSQLDRGSVQEVDVRDGIESTLVMLGHKLRGIDVRRDYADVPLVEAYAGELNQLWTNLVDNAVDAMDGSGTLTVVVRADGDDAVLVDVGDTGPGMPREVAARAFEPFFTTKEVGRGTGLGLDIARRVVVERHGGALTIHASADGTVMRTRLPRRMRT